MKSPAAYLSPWLCSALHARPLIVSGTHGLTSFPFSRKKFHCFLRQVIIAWWLNIRPLVNYLCRIAAHRVIGYLPVYRRIVVVGNAPAVYKFLRPALAWGVFNFVVFCAGGVVYPVDSKRKYRGHNQRLELIIAPSEFTSCCVLLSIVHNAAFLFQAGGAVSTPPLPACTETVAYRSALLPVVFGI